MIRHILEHIKGNFGNVESDMEELKRKIMVKEKGKRKKQSS